MVDLFVGETDLVSLRSTLLFGMKGMAAYAHHADRLGQRDEEINQWFYKGLCEINRENSVNEWLELILEFGRVNLKCMELLDKANTENFGTPVPAKVHTDIKKGPFIVVSGHDLEDLKELLEQTKGKGINVYTHGEMLPGSWLPGAFQIRASGGKFWNCMAEQQKELWYSGAGIIYNQLSEPPRQVMRIGSTLHQW